MQTFLPSPNFTESARVLDYRRLGKQRVEAFQILKALDNRNKGIKAAWINHPATLMWVGYEDALGYYMNCMISEWVQRGYNNTMVMHPLMKKLEYPNWLGDEKLHESHRIALLVKNYDHYKQFNWAAIKPLSYEYTWPKSDRLQTQLSF
jgi:hypothetical protein